LCLGRLQARSAEPDALLELAVDEISTGVDEIRELASGLHPSMLTEWGLGRALQALLERTPLPVELAAIPERRLPEPVEATAYYVVAEGLSNVYKHAHARHVVVQAATDEHRLTVTVIDDGVGGADETGRGLRGLTDRVETVGGVLMVETRAGGGTQLRAEIPYWRGAGSRTSGRGEPTAELSHARAHRRYRARRATWMQP
jgi:signal transduction histidine kinase